MIIHTVESNRTKLGQETKPIIGKGSLYRWSVLIHKSTCHLSWIKEFGKPILAHMAASNTSFLGLYTYLYAYICAYMNN